MCYKDRQKIRQLWEGTALESKYKVEGMTCDGCVRALTRAIVALKSDANVSIDLEAGIVSVPDLAESILVQAVDNAGFDFSGKA